MTPKYWFRIFLGMMAIFAVGMVVATGVRKGREKVEYIVEGTGPVSVPLLGMAFRLDGERLGGIERLRLMRSEPKRIDSAVVLVHLDDASAASRFTDCRLAVRDADNLSDNTVFFCADSADAADMELVPFGHVEFTPSGEKVVVWLPAAVVADLRASEIDTDVGADTGTVDIDGHERGLSVKVNGREVVALEGDSAGGALTVRDAHGRTIIRLNGDSVSGPIHIEPAPVVPRTGNPAQNRVRTVIP